MQRSYSSASYHREVATEAVPEDAMATFLLSSILSNLERLEKRLEEQNIHLSRAASLRTRTSGGMPPGSIQWRLRDDVRDQHRHPSAQCRPVAAVRTCDGDDDGDDRPQCLHLYFSLDQHRVDASIQIYSVHYYDEIHAFVKGCHKCMAGSSNSTGKWDTKYRSYSATLPLSADEPKETDPYKQ
ncbi:hypothetical protein GQ53DRAFT_764008 [Thozetella sp. PMI_491]|nr:hypothetical protein GQ53DRAFT_764008 [Thozetella sp. PMI_491]